MAMNKYKNLYRTTLDQVDDLPFTGVYIVAYMKQVLYVGKAEDSVIARLSGHMTQTDRFGRWLRCMRFDWPNVLVDVLEPPDDQDTRWLDQAETACIRRFRPLFNTNLYG